MPPWAFTCSTASLEAWIIGGASAAMGPEMPPTMPILTSCASAAPARAVAAKSDVAARTAALLPVAADSLSDDKVMENFLSTEGFAALGRPYTAAAEIGRAHV